MSKEHNFLEPRCSNDFIYELKNAGSQRNSVNRRILGGRKALIKPQEKPIRPRVLPLFSFPSTDEERVSDELRMSTLSY